MHIALNIFVHSEQHLRLCPENVHSRQQFECLLTQIKTVRSLVQKLRFCQTNLPSCYRPDYMRVNTYMGDSGVRMEINRQEDTSGLLAAIKINFLQTIMFCVYHLTTFIDLESLYIFIPIRKNCIILDYFCCGERSIGEILCDCKACFHRCLSVVCIWFFISVNNHQRGQKYPAFALPGALRN